MSFLKFDLGRRNRGDIAVVTLTSGANVMLVDSSGLSNYRNGRKYSYRGGLARQSPVRLAIPSTGTWYIIVDTNGLRNSAKASVRVESGPLPELRQTPLNEVPSLLRNPQPEDTDHETYDVFISHASEDKEDFVRQFAEALQEKGLRVWYDEFSLKIGDSLRRKIDQGLRYSRVGLVVLSPSFFKKGWTNYELDGIVTRAVSDEQILLPIWHNVTKQQVVDFSPSIADKVARSTATSTVDEIADEIFHLIQGVS